MEERRKAKRVEIAIDVSVEGRAAPFQVRTQNLSAGGALWSSPEEPRPDQIVRAGIRLEEERPPLAALARVVWCRRRREQAGWYAGVRFEKMSAEDRQRLRQWIREIRKNLLAFMKEYPAFSAFTELDRARLGLYCFRHDLDAGESFYREGESGVSLFLIRRGTVRIYKRYASGREVTIATAGSGEIFGEISLIIRKPHGANVKAVVPTEVIGISSAAFDYLKWRSPRLAVKLMDVLLRSLANRLGQTTRRLLSPIRIDEIA